MVTKFTAKTPGANVLTISMWHIDSYQFCIISLKKVNIKRSKEMPYSEMWTQCVASGINLNGEHVWKWN